jgi:hypothetical protein
LIGLLLVAAVCVAVIVWDMRRGGAGSGGIRAGHAIRAGGDIRADSGIQAGWGIDAGGTIQAGRELTADAESLAGVLAAAAKDGRRLSADAIELEPIGHLPHVDDLVRRCNDWEARVSDALARDEDLPDEWRTAWLSDPDWPNPHVNPTRHDLDRLAQTIGYRLRLIDQMRRVLCARENS